MVTRGTELKVSSCIGCESFPCEDVDKNVYSVADVDLEPDSIKMAMVSEAAPPDPADNYYATGDTLFQRTTLQAFEDADFSISSTRELLDRGIYLTTAIKCGKIEYGIRSGTVRECSRILGEELSLFPDLEVLMLMGDVAIKSINYIARASGEEGVIPTGATYRIRGGEFHFRGMRAFPSYLQAGPSFFIEKSKRRMIAEDIAAALRLLG
jgi:uracil-DNA glycosylase